jgi:RNA polymerase sigma factor (sigma-70 family)
VDTDKGLPPAMPVPLAEQEVSPPDGFVGFYRAHYRDLLRSAMYAGATKREADEAAQAVMKEVLKHWSKLKDPLAYARRGVVSNYIKDKTRGLDRTRHRLVERGAGTAEGREDPNLTVWENREWVMQILQSLPPGQREVMAFIIDGFAPTEVAALLGRSPDAVRQSLCAARRRLKEVLRREQADEQQLESGTGPAWRAGQ